MKKRKKMNIKNSTLAWTCSRGHQSERGRGGDETANTKCYPATIARTNPLLPTTPTPSPTHFSHSNPGRLCIIPKTERSHTRSDEILMSTIRLSLAPLSPASTHLLIQCPSPRVYFDISFLFLFAIGYNIGHTVIVVVTLVNHCAFSFCRNDIYFIIVSEASTTRYIIIGHSVDSD